jgi:ABC-type glycerol-3-phosphate transport system substrate-binding protein
VRRIKTVSVAVLATATAMAAVGCGGSKGSGDANGTAKEITVAVSSSPSDTALRKMAPGFEKQTGIKVKFVELPYQQLAAKVLLAARQGSGGYDVVQFDSPMLAPLAAGGAIADIGSRVTSSTIYDNSDFPKQVQDYAKYRGTTYAIPLSTEPYVLWYRKDLFKKLGLSAPDTWDQYTANAQKLHAAGIGGSDSGFGSDIGAYYWLEAIYAHGGTLLEPGSCTPALDSPEAKAATEQYLRMLPYTPATAVNGGGNEMTTAFVQRQAGQEVNATGYYSIMADPKQSKVVGKFAAAVPPGAQATDRHTLLFGWLIGLGAKSKAQKSGWQFLEYALGKENTAKLIGYGAPPPARRSLQSDPTIAKQLPYLPTLLKAAEVGQHLPYIPQMPEIITALSAALSKTATGDRSATKLLSTANKRVGDILGDTTGCA